MEQTTKDPGLLKFKRNHLGLIEICNTKEELEDIKSRVATVSDAANNPDVIRRPCGRRPKSPSVSVEPAAPRKAFYWIPETFKNNFSAGQKLEGIDPNHPEMWCALSVAEVRGHRLRLHFDGYSTAYDFWTNCWDSLIRPIDFAVQSGRALCPPRGFDASLFEWESYMEMVACVAAPSSAFIASPSMPSKNPSIKQEIDADIMIENPFEPSAERVPGKLVDILDQRHVLVSATNEENPMIFWAQVGSPFIGPENLDHPNNFEVGQKLEFVDPLDASLIRLGRIKEIIDTPGSGDEDCWLPVNSPDLFPISFAGGCNIKLQLASVENLEGRIKAKSGYGKIGLAAKRPNDIASLIPLPSSLPDRFSGPVSRRYVNMTLQAAMQSQLQQQQQSQQYPSQQQDLRPKRTASSTSLFPARNFRNRKPESTATSTTKHIPQHNTSDIQASAAKAPGEYNECTIDESHGTTAVSDQPKAVTRQLSRESQRDNGKQGSDDKVSQAYTPIPCSSKRATAENLALPKTTTFPTATSAGVVITSGRKRKSTDSSQNSSLNSGQ